MANPLTGDYDLCVEIHPNLISKLVRFLLGSRPEFQSRQTWPVTISAQGTTLNGEFILSIANIWTEVLSSISSEPRVRINLEFENAALQINTPKEAILRNLEGKIEWSVPIYLTDPETNDDGNRTTRLAIGFAEVTNVNLRPHTGSSSNLATFGYNRFNIKDPGVLYSGFTDAISSAIEAIGEAIGNQEPPVGFNFELTDKEENSGSLTPLRFVDLTLATVPGLSGYRGSVPVLLGTFLRDHKGHGNPANKTEFALEEGGDVSLSLNSVAIRQLVFCPAVADGLGANTQTALPSVCGQADAFNILDAPAKLTHVSINMRQGYIELRGHVANNHKALRGSIDFLVKATLQLNDDGKIVATAEEPVIQGGIGLHWAWNFVAPGLVEILNVAAIKPWVRDQAYEAITEALKELPETPLPIDPATPKKLEVNPLGLTVWGEVPFQVPDQDQPAPQPARLNIKYEKFRESRDVPESERKETVNTDCVNGTFFVYDREWQTTYVFTAQTENMAEPVRFKWWVHGDYREGSGTLESTQGGAAGGAELTLHYEGDGNELRLRRDYGGGGPAQVTVSCYAIGDAETVATSEDYLIDFAGTQTVFSAEYWEQVKACTEDFFESEHLPPNRPWEIDPEEILDSNYLGPHIIYTIGGMIRASGAKTPRWLEESAKLVGKIDTDQFIKGVKLRDIPLKESAKPDKEVQGRVPDKNIKKGIRLKKEVQKLRRQSKLKAKEATLRETKIKTKRR